MDRRLLLQWMVSTGGIAAFGRFSLHDLESLGSGAHARAVAAGRGSASMTAAELRTVAAAAECIIPRTDTPGATDANVAAFVDVMLRDWYPPSDAQRFRAGLAALDTASMERFRTAYADATQAQQAELAQRYDDEVTTLRRTDASAANAHWFAMLKWLTVWGYCTSESAMRNVFHSHPRPMRFDGAAPVG